MKRDPSASFRDAAGLHFLCGHSRDSRTRSDRIQVDENLARAGAVLWADDTLVLHDFHDASGSVVADPEPTLEHRGAGALGRFQDVECLLVQLAVVAHIAVIARA